jgi:predicted polyphosphate/ATP-dependent NAD kinase
LALVGIVANPAASKDIRRLVAHGRVVPDWEKVNIVRRVLLGLQAVGVKRAVAMPDLSHLCRRARDDNQLSLDIDLLDMSVFSSTQDSTRAATMMREMGVGCLVTLGGDGTNRAVAKGCGQVPLIPISTGTNNVFPTMMEGTLAGMAAGILAEGMIDADQVCTVSKRIDVYLDGEYRDMALVDVAVSRERFVASRAIWDVGTLYEVFLTRAEPTSIGLSSIGAQLRPVTMTDDVGLYYRPGNGENAGGGMSVLAPVAPGIIRRVPIEDWRLLPIGERVRVDHKPCTIALDGEREFSVLPDQKVEVAVNSGGPRVVVLEAALREAAIQQVFAASDV